jgi:transposase
MEQQLLNLPGCQIDQMVLRDGLLIVRAHTVEPEAACPYCGAISRRVHSYYIRCASDLPVSDRRVRLHLTCRRFRCVNKLCSRTTFAEPIPALLARYARRSNRLTRALYYAGQELGGQASSRLLRLLHIRVSGRTVLRILRREHSWPVTTPQAIGVDDWAQRRGYTYRTILVDLQTHAILDLLPDRTSATLAARLQLLPELRIVARDRSTEYAKGIALGAPQARQVADRWHLLQNLGQAMERHIGRIYAQLRALPPLVGAPFEQQTLSSGRTIFVRTKRDVSAKQDRRSRRMALYKEVQRLRSEGYNIRQIAQRLAHHRNTVRKYFYAEAFPERASKPLVPSMIDPYLPYLTRRLEEGCENARQLCREIREQGYSGNYGQISKWLRPLRTRLAKSTAKAHLGSTAPTEPELPASSFPSAKTLAWLLLRSPAKLDSAEEHIRQHICQDESVAKLYELVQQFFSLVRNQNKDDLAHWLQSCSSCGIAALETFAQGLERELDSVQAALELPWSNGPTEGCINRLKLLKRQGYGRASLELMRIRATYVPP